MKNLACTTAAALALYAAVPSIAAPVTWSAPVTTTDEEDIQANVSSAFNLFNQNVTTDVTTTTQTVSFVSSNTGTMTSGALTLTITGGFNAGIPDIGAWGTGSPTDLDFKNPVMDSFAHTGNVGNGGPSLGTFELSGLTPGTQYSVQLFAADTRNNIGNVRTIQYDDGEGNSTASVLQNTSPYFIGTFTADGTTQAFGASSTTTNLSNASAVLNAVTVTVIPEPGSLALLGLGGLLIARRRRG